MSPGSKEYKHDIYNQISLCIHNVKYIETLLEGEKKRSEEALGLSDYLRKRNR